jgi:uncharacterized membrane protein YgdD (TMEM256/DUF423 family)
MPRTFTILAAAFAFLGVAAGAFGTHALRAYFDAHTDLQAIYDTAVQYQLYHALALLGAAWASSQWPGRWTRAAGYLFAVGIVIFSGSLYILSLTNMRVMGAITPLGGLAFLSGWFCLGWAAWKQKSPLP